MPEVGMPVDMQQSVAAAPAQREADAEQQAAVASEDERSPALVQQRGQPARQPDRIVEDGVLVADPAGPGVVDVAGAADQAGVRCAEPLVQPGRAEHLGRLGTTRRGGRDRWA